MTESVENRVAAVGLERLLASHGNVLRRAMQSADGLKERLPRPAAPTAEPAAVFRLQPGAEPGVDD